MKFKINKKVNLEELFENKDRSWEDTMNFLKEVKYEEDIDKIFEGHFGESGATININCDKLYCVNKSIFEIIEEPKMKGNMYKYVAVGSNVEVINDKFDFSIISRMLNNSNYFCTKVLVYNYYENKVFEYTQQTTYELKELGDIDKK